MGRGAAQAVVEAASDLIGRSDFGGRTALQAAASMGLPPGIFSCWKNSRDIHATFATVWYRCSCRRARTASGKPPRLRRRVIGRRFAD